MTRFPAIALAFFLSAPAAQTPPRSSSRPLVGTYWRAIELGGRTTPAQDPVREAHLQFQADGRVSGSDGCNRTTGGYTLNGESLTFGRMAATRMACLDTGDAERSFRDALEATMRWRITGDRLELFSGSGDRLAVFEARAQPPDAPT
jgi:heat shock protein HslJ